MSLLMRFGAICLTAIALVFPAHAIPVSWTLEFTATDTSGLVYESLSGTFVYDEDTDVFSDINLERGDGTIFDQDMRGLPGPFNGVTGFLIGTDGPADDLSGARGFIWSAPLTDAGGMFLLDVSSMSNIEEFDIPEYIGCGNSDCTAAFFEETFLLFNGDFAGTLVGTPVQSVPLPATGYLLAATLLAGGFLGKRRRSQGRPAQLSTFAPGHERR